MCDNEIDEGQGEEAVDCQATDHSDNIHGNFLTYLSNVFHVYNLTCQQEEDSHGAIPVTKRWDSREQENVTNTRAMNYYIIYLKPCNQMATDNFSSSQNNPNAYQMTISTRCMMALLRQSNKSLRGFPWVSILPRMRPKATEKTNRPKKFTPSVVPGIGTAAHIDVIKRSMRWWNDNV